MESDHATLDRVADLYRQGRYLDALAASEPLGPPEAWTGARASVLAGRLATMLGAPRLGRVLHARAWRRYPSEPEAVYFHAIGLLVRRGPWPCLELIRRYGDLPGADGSIQADWFALSGQVLAILRDFESAEDCLARAEKLAPTRPWIWVEKAVLLEAEDRPEDALGAAQHALRLRPWFRPAVQAAAHYLVQLNRDEEALALLTEAARHLQCGDLLIQRASLERELGRYREAREDLNRAAPLLPLMSRDRKRRMAFDAQRADAAYHCGDLREAARLSALVDVPFFKETAKRLAAEPLEGKRVVLTVGFVRQHHVTCAPATLSAISAYWSKPADHLEVAERICYDGTPAHSERRWAEENGFAVREFRITWDSATALLDRGIPFALHTVDPGSAHLQAVIGYDSRRGTFLVRDPSERHYGEVLGEELLKHYRSTGPRGLALVPEEQADRFAGLDLPDAALYDDCYRIERALQAHDRPQAQETHVRMRAEHANHPLTLRSRGAMAAYDADPINILKTAEQLLKEFPEDANLLVSKLNCLRELGRRDDRLSMLRELCGRPEPAPFFLIRYAQELVEDARSHGETLAVLRRTMRMRPIDPDNYGLLADVLWERRRRDEALALYRFAACLADKDQARARSYFIAARHLRQTERAITMLKDRFARFGGRSSHPAQTLCWAFETLEQTGTALEVLEEALARRPDDGELLLFAADMYGRYGRAERAAELHGRAEGNSHRMAWLRTASYLALYQSDQRSALDRAREVLKTEPLARDANDLAAQLLADLEGDAAAIAHIRQAVERFPHSYGLRVLLIEWLRRQDPAAAEPAIRELLERQPVDPWARRELAITLIEQSKWDEAEDEADLAIQLEPSNPLGHLIQGRIRQAAGRVEEARACFRDAITVSVDFDPAIAALMQTCDSKADRLDALEFLRGELVRQVIFGDGLLAFCDYASATLDAQTLLGTLRDALAARPELWHAHAALIRQLTEIERTDEARDLAEAAVAQFPLLPRMWLELAAVCRARKDDAGEIAALAKAREISPNWGEPARLLAETYQRQGDMERAAALLEQMVPREPREARNHAYLADALWALDRRDEAIERMTQAVRLEPGYDWAWNMLRDWSAAVDQPRRALDVAQELTRLRPQQARSWLVLARVLAAEDQRAARLEALDRAAALNPCLPEVHSMRAACLAEMERYDEALAACRPEALADAVPLELAAREADVEFRRGNADAAVERMREVVAHDPDYLWAWTRLADWHDQAGRDEDYLQAAENMVRVAPGLPACWGYRGDARRRTQDRQGAAEDLQRALEMAPDYLFAAMGLLDVQFEGDDLEGAARTLEVAAPHMPPEFALAQQIRLDARRRDRQGALAHFRQLCALPLEDAQALDAAVAEMAEEPWMPAVAEELCRQVARDDVAPPVVEVWAECLARTGRWDRCEPTLQRMADREEAWRAGAARWLIALGSAARPEPLQAFIRRNRKRLRRHAHTWAAAGQALSDVDLDRNAVRWLSDWPRRDDVTPQALFYLVLSLWKLGRRHKAVEASRRALEMPPDHSAPFHLLWLAVDRVLEGEEPAAREMLQPLDAGTFNQYYAALYELVAVAADSRPYAEAAGRMRAVRGGAPGEVARDVLFRTIYRRLRRRLARRHGRGAQAAWQWLCGAVGA